MSDITEEKPKSSLIKVEEIAVTMQNAGDILIKNESLLAKAANKGQSYLDTIEAGEMTDDLDAELNKWQVNAKSALEIMNTRRAPITQMLTQLAKAFTSLEAKIDPTKPESVYSKIQTHRNAFAKKKAEDARVKEQLILKQQAIEKEKIEIKAKAEQQLRESFQNKLLEFKSFYTSKLNSSTLDTFEKATATIKSIPTSYPRDKFYELVVSVSPIYLAKEDTAAIIFNTKVALFDELSANFKENMEDHQRSLIDQLPSKKAELLAIQKAGAEKKAELEAAALKRQQEETLRLQQEAQAAKERDTQNVAMQANIAQSTNLFESAAALSEVKSENAGPVRQGYKIAVASPAGWGAIFMFWFEKEGQKMKPEDMGKKTLDQMKAFCEKHAFKTSEKIDHVHVTYEDDYKAIAKAA